ncbi:MAG: sigma factor-like helix-turn-helix DNA-binding protein [Candidatus Coprovivens sp.]
MEEYVYYNSLFDIYGNLLTKKERETFRDYYQEDLSLSEIALENNISRAAVQKTVKNVLEKLKYYEEKLKIYQKNSRLREIIELEDVTEIKNEIGKILSD